MEVYVDTAGRDDGPGSISAPFRTLHRALDWLEQVRAADGRAGPDAALIINLLPGRHRLDRSLMFGPEHAGTSRSPSILRGQDGAVVSGASETVASAPADAVCRLNPALKAFRISATDPRPEMGDFGFNRQIAPSPPFVLTETGLLRSARSPARGWFTPTAAISDNDGTTLVLTIDPDLFQQIEDEPALWIEFILEEDWEWHIARVQSIDAATKRLTIALPRPKTGAGSIRFAFRNLRSGLAQPGTSWLDPAGSQIVVHPPRSGTTEVCLMPGHLVRLHETSNIRFEALSFRGGLANAIHGTGCDSVSIVGCSADGFAAGGFHIEGQETEIVGSTVRDVGTCPVRIVAGNRDTLTSGKSLVERCIFSGWGWRKPVYEPAVRLIGVGTTVRECEFLDAPHMAVELAGNDHLVEACIFSGVVAMIDDMGAIYVNSGENLLERGHRIRWNLFRDIGAERKIASAVYLDRCSSGISVSENVFCRIANGAEGFIRAIHINGGRDIDVSGNLFVDCNCAVEYDFYLNTWGMRDAPLLGAGLARSMTRMSASPHRERYAELAGLSTESLLRPRSNRVNGNMIFLGSDQARAIVISGARAELVEQIGNVVIPSTQENFEVGGRWAELIAPKNIAELRLAIEQLAQRWSALIFDPAVP